MKRLQFQRITKAAILLVLLSAAVAIVWNFSWRQREEAAAAERDLLSENVSRRSLDFEHSEFRAGNILFRVQAETDTLTAEGTHELQQVELVTYDADGGPGDWVRGRQARYLIDAKQIEFREAVEIRLADGTVIFSERLLANLDTQRIEIDQSFRFQRGDARGEGGAMTYWTGPKRLEIGEGFRISFPGPGSPKATSRGAVYDISRGQLRLDGEVQLADSRHRLVSNRLDVELGPQQHVQRLSAQGSAELTTQPGRLFSGQAIDFEFDSGSGQLSFFDVAAAPGGRARFREAPGTSIRELEADHLRVLARPNQAGEHDLRFSRLAADGRVSLRFPAKQLREVTAERLEGSFEESGELRRLTMEGSVRASAQDGGKLQSRVLSVELDALQQPTAIRAAGQVQATLPFAEGERTLSTPHDLDLAFREGLLSRADCWRDCTLVVQAVSGSTRLEAARLAASFAGGLAEVVEAAGAVAIVQDEPGMRRRTRSEKLTVRYRDGALVSAVQEGGFRLDEDEGEEGSVLTGEQAAFDPGTEVIRVEGGQPQLLRRDPGSDDAIQTWARTFNLHRSRNQLSAESKVVSRFQRAEGPMEITAGSMHSGEDGWVEYRGNPRLTERENSLTAGLIRFHPADDLLEAREDVDSQVRLGTSDGSREYRIRSQRMELQRSLKTALYQGAVKAHSDDLNVRSEQLQLEFSDTALSQVDKISAWGGVEVKDATRTAQGERSLYFPAEGKVQVYGSPAIVVDSKQGKAAGAVLTFFTGDERMLVQNRLAEGQP